MERGKGMLAACGVMLERFLSAYSDEEMDDLIAYLETQEGWEPFLAMARSVRATPWEDVTEEVMGADSNLR